MADILMGCQKGKKYKMYGVKWTLVRNLQVVTLLLGEMLAMISVVSSVGENGVAYGKQGYGGLRRIPYKSLTVNKQSLQQQRRLKAPGNEIIPAVSANDISEEPTCEELRAMWRYYKRQSRAELTNEIPQFGKNPFFDMFPAVSHIPVMSSFGLQKGRSKNRMRPQNPLYGRVVYKPSNKQRERNRNRNSKPFDTVRDMLGRNGNRNREGGGGSGHTTPPSGIVHFSPPPQPTRESSFQKLKDVFREERLREKGSTPLGGSGDNREYGKIVLSPPVGQDGRRVNKPPELMTPFEKIRFGLADDVLDEGIKPNLDVMKRRAIPPPVLNKQQQQPQPYQQHLLPQWPQVEKRRFLSNPILLLAPSSSRSGQTTSSSSINFPMRVAENNNNLIVHHSNDKQQLDDEYDESQDVPSQLYHENYPALANLDYPFPRSSSVDAFSSKFSNPPGQTVEMPTCAEVEHDSCNQTSDCSCIGFALYRCYLNQCQILPLAYSVQEEPAVRAEESWAADSQSPSSPDIWHSDALPSEKLGIWEDPVDPARLTLNGKKHRNRRDGKRSRITETTYFMLPGRNLFA